MSNEQNAYDRVAYPGSLNAKTHPASVAAMALLHGFSPAPVESCRVLEIGCNEGNNLIPMAYAIPGGQFTGLDLAALPVARGRQRIVGMGLTNIRLLEADLVDLDASLGQFDYIIAHGVYAWVPPPVRDRLLAVTKLLLAPRGIAFISYNALPGGHLRHLIRDILRNTPSLGDGAGELARALNSLSFVAQARPAGDPLRALLEEEMEQLQRKGPQVLFHDELAPDFDPALFSSFVAHAGRHGLRYLSEAMFPPPTDPMYKPAIASAARERAQGDPLVEEQTLDFIRFRKYRETLLCHASCSVSRSVDLHGLMYLHLASPAELSAGPAPGTAVFSRGTDVRIESSHPALILIMQFLVEAWPRSIPMEQLVAVLEENSMPVGRDLLTRIFRLAVARVVELRGWSAPVSLGIPECPRISAYAAAQARTQEKVATLLHTMVLLEDPLTRDFVALLDGTRNRGALLKTMREQHPQTSAESLLAGLDPGLAFLHRAGLLLDEDFD